MTRKIDLNAAQIAQIKSTNEATCGRISVQPAITAKTSFAFFAAFDGTNNDKDNVPQGELCTNVAQLWNQYDQQRQRKPSNRFGGGYYKGPGAPGTLSQSSWLPDRVKEQVIIMAENAYHDFCAQAAQAGDINNVAAAISSFSRGGASAAIFCQMLYERGLIHPDTKAVLIPPKEVSIVGGVIFDPVLTGVHTSLAYPPNVHSLINLRALNEYRYLFPSADYSKHPDAIVNTYDIYGNHCDVGGGYDNGLAGLTLTTATRIFQRLGLPIAGFPTERAYMPDQIAVHSEEYDNYGHKLWDVSNEDGFSFADVRQTAGVGAPFGPDISGSERFLMYNGDVVY